MQNMELIMLRELVMNLDRDFHVHKQKLMQQRNWRRNSRNIVMKPIWTRFQQSPISILEGLF